MKKVILNKCYGGFCVSPKAYFEYARRLNKKIYVYKFDFSSRKYFLVNKKNVSNRDLSNCLTLHFTFTNCGRITTDIKDVLYLDDSYREDKNLIDIVEQLGEDASDSVSRLTVVEIPDDLDYVINSYDGFETLHQKVQVW